MATKVNPRRISATRADVKKAYMDGIDLGLKQAVKMLLYVLVDKHDVPLEDVQRIGEEMNWVGQAINEGRISWSFIDIVLHENDLEVRLK